MGGADDGAPGGGWGGGGGGGGGEVGVEEVGEGAGEDAGDFEDAVAGCEEGVEGGDYGEGGSDGGFVVEEAAGGRRVGGRGVCEFLGRWICGVFIVDFIVDGMPKGYVAAEGFFVRRYDADAAG